MTKWRQPVYLAILAILSACGSNEPKEVDCDANLKYQNRVEGPRVVAPEGLDQLNEWAEMPIPRADPNAPKMPKGVCNDEPPIIDAGS
jgi:uncharacterized lipoprotein